MRCLAPTIAALFVLAGCSHDRPTAPGTAASVPTATSASTYPDGWSEGLGSPTTQFSITLDHKNTHGGTGSATLAATVVAPTSFATITQFIRADNYRGHRVKWSAWVRPSAVAGDGAGAWMRIDGPGVTLAFDNMIAGGRPILGTSGWTQVSVVLDVPASAIGISFGVLLAGSGSVSVDDCSMGFVGAEVATTSLFGSPQTSSVDSASVVSNYSRDPFDPVNLDFEGLVATGVGSAALNWLAQSVVPFRTVQADADFSDLSPLQQMIGSARLVGVGEATHGTREFFQMKQRIFEYLVRNMGFTYFAIEATWPEANDMNQYVLNGTGDPAKLLSHLYFWTWNTQEVLDFVLWMRQWNTTAPANQRVQFLGFDMQSPGAAMDTVASFISRVDPAMNGWLNQRYACLGPYRNHAQNGPDFAGYAALSSSVRVACAAGLQDVFTLIDTNGAAFQTTFQAGTPLAVYANALHSARIVQQWEQLAGGTGETRDQSMAENVQWLLDQAGPTAKMMLWAHNGHVMHAFGSMGATLRAVYGTSYLNAGFAFGVGGFNAVGDVGSGCSGLCAFQTNYVPANSIESAFISVGRPLLLLDTRRIDAGGASAAPLHGPLLMRSIGAVFSPAQQANYFGLQLFPDDFDLLIYVGTTTRSTLLPFQY